MNDKETLEEAAKKFYPTTTDFICSPKLVSFIAGAKWQAERMYSEEELQQKINAHLEVSKDLWLYAIKEQKRMYSEEEVVNILIKAYEDIGKRKIPNQVVLASWFKQFKKK